MIPWAYLTGFLLQQNNEFAPAPDYFDDYYCAGRTARKPTGEVHKPQCQASAWARYERTWVIPFHDDRLLLGFYFLTKPETWQLKPKCFSGCVRHDSFMTNKRVIFSCLQALAHMWKVGNVDHAQWIPMCGHVPILSALFALGTPVQRRSPKYAAALGMNVILYLVIPLTLILSAMIITSSVKFL